MGTIYENSRNSRNSRNSSKVEHCSERCMFMPSPSIESKLSVWKDRYCGFAQIAKTIKRKRDNTLSISIECYIHRKQSELSGDFSQVLTQRMIHCLTLFLLELWLIFDLAPNERTYIFPLTLDPLLGPHLHERKFSTVSRYCKSFLLKKLYVNK